MKLRDQLVYFSHRAAEKNLVSGLDGNLSVRKKDGTVLITSSGVNKGILCGKDVCGMTVTGKQLSGERRISTEAKMHLAFYHNRKDIRAVVHCHPVYTTALVTAGIDINAPIFPEVVLGLGKIAVAEYATPSTDEVADSFAADIRTALCVVLKNHGAVTVGRTLEEAYYRMETLENAMQMYFIALQAGNPSVLTSSQLNKLYNIAPAAYGINLAPELKHTTVE